MVDAPDNTVPPSGLEDHSEELSERSEADVQVRFYQAMAATDVAYEDLLDRLARAVADVIFDLCVVYLLEGDGTLRCAAAYHPHRETLSSLHEAFARPQNGLGDGLVHQVIQRQELYFRPRFNLSVLQAYSDQSDPPDLDIPIHSLIVVPLVTTDGRCLGALLMGRQSTSLAYDKRDLALTQWIASHAAMKLETARLYSDLQAAVAERDTFISIASHELRTPLSTLKLHAQMLQRIAHQTPEKLTLEYLLPKLASIERGVDRLDGLIDQLLNVHRIMDDGLTPDLTSCDLIAITRTAIQRLSFELERSGSTLTITAGSSLQGTWDRCRLDHIVTNLVSNAIKYGRGNPIEVGCVPEAGQQVRLYVTDGGAGISPDAQPRIFERFERATDSGPAGLGLGLWIVREYVESLGGSISVTSTPGQGSTFTVTLPRHASLD